MTSTMRPTTLERAFAVAREGRVVSLYDIVQTLQAEGYADCVAQLSGPSLRAQLRLLIQRAHSEVEANLPSG